MSQTPKFDLAIIGLGYVGLPLGLQFTNSGVGFFEDHAVIDENKVAAGSGSLRDAENRQNRQELNWFWIRKSGLKRPRVATYAWTKFGEQEAARLRLRLHLRK